MPESHAQLKGVAIPALILCGIVVLDYAGAFRYVPYWFGSLAALIFAAIGIRDLRPRKWSVLALGVLVASLLLVPAIRWNQLKSFYLDCGAIEPGSLIADVRDQMRLYHLQQTSGGGPSHAKLDRPHLTFHPDRDRSADWCVVYYEGDRVTEVESLPD